MVDFKIVEEWLDKAERDFQFAIRALDRGERFYELICFHFQQAGEKYLKAYIVANELEFKKIHDLGELVQICQRKNSDFKMGWSIAIDSSAVTTFSSDHKSALLHSELMRKNVLKRYT